MEYKLIKKPIQCKRKKGGQMVQIEKIVNDRYKLKYTNYHSKCIWSQDCGGACMRLLRYT